MSLSVNLSSAGIRDAYEKVLDGVQDYVVLSYRKLSNDLDVGAAGKGSLDDVAEEFSDGKIQYAFVRVTDPNTKLPKFVLINWCGEGVPETRKGLFPSHSASVADYFRAYHVSINARTEHDVEPAVIMRKITDSSGSKYNAAGAAANTHPGGPITPVGTSHKPVGTPDIRGMQAKAPKDKIEPVGTNYTPAREEIAQLRAGKLGAQESAPPPAPRPSAPTPASAARVPQPQGAPSAPAPPPAAPPAPEPAQKAPEPPAGPPKPADDDKIRPVGTAYTPVSLGKPGKLSTDRTAMFSQPPASASAPPPAPGRRGPSGGKLTWSQRQEAAKKEQQAEAERESAVASSEARASAAEEPPAPPAAPEAPPAPPDRKSVV